MNQADETQTGRSQFDLIAPYYDDLMAGVPYGLWVDYLQEILRRAGSAPKSVLDVACGTGNVSEELASRGFEVVGVDVAPRMIEAARAKNSSVKYYVQDLAELDLGRQFDLAVCLFDSLNYVTDTDKLRQGLRRIAGHLSCGGLFIFDINTIYALSHHFFDQANLASENYPRYVWSSEYDHTTRICTVSMLFEVRDGESVSQFKEVHLQRGHSIEELSAWLIESGFEVVNTYHAYGFKRPGRRSDRVFFVARRV